MVDSLNPHQFVKKNYKWLSKWIENAKPVQEYKGMQIFKGCIGASRECDKEAPEEEIIKLFKPEEIKYIKNQHIENILMACIFSISFTTMAQNGNPVICMNGFLNQIGRLPTKDDGVTIEYLEGNGITRWQKENYFPIPHIGYDGGIYYIPTYQILSECRLKIG